MNKKLLFSLALFVFAQNISAMQEEPVAREQEEAEQDLERRLQEERGARLEAEDQRWQEEREAINQRTYLQWEVRQQVRGITRYNCDLQAIFQDTAWGDNTSVEELQQLQNYLNEIEQLERQHQIAYRQLLQERPRRLGEDDMPFNERMQELRNIKNNIERRIERNRRNQERRAELAEQRREQLAQREVQRREQPSSLPAFINAPNIFLVTAGTALVSYISYFIYQKYKEYKNRQKRKKIAQQKLTMPRQF